jgi:hypothetical protein
MPGQLQVVSGLRVCGDTTMSLEFGKETETVFTAKGPILGGYVGYTFGFVRFATTEEDLLGWDVWHVSWTGRTIVKHGKTQDQIDATANFWVDKNGQIRRQTETFDDAKKHVQGKADYFPDHIQITRSRDGKSETQLLYPMAEEFGLLNDQFKPMVVDGKVVLREKSYLYLDLLGGGFQKRTARVAGRFSGKACDAYFHGYEVEIEFEKHQEGACISDDNDLVKVDLQDGRTIVMTSLPSNRLKDGVPVKGHG